MAAMRAMETKEASGHLGGLGDLGFVDESTNDGLLGGALEGQQHRAKASLQRRRRKNC